MDFEMGDELRTAVEGIVNKVGGVTALILRCDSMMSSRENGYRNR